MGRGTDKDKDRGKGMGNQAATRVHLLLALLQLVHCWERGMAAGMALVGTGKGMGTQERNPVLDNWDLTYCPRTLSSRSKKTPVLHLHLNFVAEL